MTQPKSIWINLDEKEVDVTYLDKRFSEKGYHFIKKDIKKDEDLTIEMAKNIDVIISILEPWNKKTLNSIKGKKKFIMRYGTGLDNIDMPYATKLGIPVANIPGVNSAAVAEIALIHILNVGRRFFQCVQGVKDGIYPSKITGNELDNKTVGLIGLGTIARQLVRMLKGFDVNIIAYDPFLDSIGKQFATDAHIILYNTMEKVFSNSDIVSLHIPLNDSTKECIGSDILKTAKPGLYLINTCRGGVIDEKALVRALKTNVIRGVGLDVLYQEPPEKNNPLLKMDNVWITSHIGAASIESEQRSQIIIADTIDAFFEGKIPSNIKNPETLKNQG